MFLGVACMGHWVAVALPYFIRLQRCLGCLRMRLATSWHMTRTL
ncbi:hypothetical protein DSUL_20353 [Desulfovibrionales bacterium]